MSSLYISHDKGYGEGDSVGEFCWLWHFSVATGASGGSTFVYTQRNRVAAVKNYNTVLLVYMTRKKSRGGECCRPLDFGGIAGGG